MGIDIIFKETRLIVLDLITNGTDLEAEISGNSIKGYLDDHLIEFKMEPEAWLWEGELLSRVTFELIIDGRTINGNNTIRSNQHSTIKSMYELNKQIRTIGMRGKDTAKQIGYYHKKVESLKKLSK